MIFAEIGIAGIMPCGWAYQPRRDDEEPDKIVRGSVQGTPNETILYAANYFLEKLGNAQPAHCGAVGVDGVTVSIRASQLYLVNGMNGKDNGRANRDLWDTLQETARRRAFEGFVIRWQHIPVEDNPMRDIAAIAAKECVPFPLESSRGGGGLATPAPWEDT